jgi:hypothetical protein
MAKNQSLAQYEVDVIAWINLVVSLMSVLFLGFYIYTTLDGVKNVDVFFSHHPLGKELIITVVKASVLLVLWTPMSIFLKVAASRRSRSLLKMWSVFQMMFIFIIAIHLLVHPPKTLIIVFAYTTSFFYLLISLWLCETLIQEIKNGGPTSGRFCKMDVTSEVQNAHLLLSPTGPGRPSILRLNSSEEYNNNYV